MAETRERSAEERGPPPNDQGKPTKAKEKTMNYKNVRSKKKLLRIKPGNKTKKTERTKEPNAATRFPADQLDRRGEILSDPVLHLSRKSQQKGE